MFRDISEEYSVISKRPGKVVRMEYDAPTERKYACVYTPYGYDSSKKYEIIYLMHGGGGRQEDYFGDDAHVTRFKKAVDHLIENGEMRPIIMVFPTVYLSKHDKKSKEESYDAVFEFLGEIETCLIPKVETEYSSYAESVDEAGLVASRDHRAFGGFSMGAVTTWYLFSQKLKYFSKFIPISADAWIVERKGGASRPEETAQALSEVVGTQGYSKKDFLIYAVTGSEDRAARGLVPMMNAMKDCSDVFDFRDGGNTSFFLHEGGKHEMKYVKQYLFNILPIIYGKC